MIKLVFQFGRGPCWPLYARRAQLKQFSTGLQHKLLILIEYIVYWKLAKKTKWVWSPLCEKKCPNTVYFWSVFSCTHTEYVDLFRKYPYSVQKSPSIFSLNTGKYRPEKTKWILLLVLRKRAKLGWLNSIINRLFHILHREYILKQEVVVVETPK